MRLLLLFPIILLLVLNTASVSETAEIVIINANIRTMSAEQPSAEAVAISSGVIIAVGTNRAVRAFIRVGTRVIDARGRLVLPGFNDAHVHFMAIGNSFSSIDLRNADSAEEMSRRIAFYAAFLPKGRWILGGQWNHENWTPKSLPTRELIDAVSPDNPVLLYHSDPQIAIANSLALKIAGIDKNVKIFTDGELVRDGNGSPTGVLRGGAIDLVRQFVPVTHTRNWIEIAETATNYAASLGVTSVQDMHSDDQAEVYRELERRGKLKTRIYDCIPLRDWSRLSEQRIGPKSNQRAMVRRGCLKSFSEGEAGDVPRLRPDIAVADKAGLQVMLHAIGVRPNRLVLGIFEDVARENGKRDRRFRIEHAQNAGESALTGFKKTGAIASMQPWLFFRGNGNGGADFRMLLDSGIPLAFGSDASITDFNPLFGIYAAVSGVTHINGKNGLRRTFSVEDAVRAYTLGSAYAEFQDNVKGTLGPGKLADLIILSDDIFVIDPERIRGVRIDLTMVNGKVVFERK